MLRRPTAFPTPLWSEDIILPPSLGSLFVELHLLIWYHKVVFPGVPVFLLDLAEHPPWFPFPPSIEAVRSRHALSKQMSEPEGITMSPVPGKRDRFTSTRCCGLDQRNGTDGESRHTRSKETDVNVESTFSPRRRSQYARSSGWRRYRASKSQTGGTVSENGACLRRSLHVEDRFAESSWKNRRTSNAL
jgi:hypothetical protein